MKYELPELAYSYDALEPYFDAQTMEIHHSKHHAGYTNKLNATLEKYPDLSNISLEDLLGELKFLEMDEGDKKSLQNNGGGYLNHKLFWEILDPSKAVDEELKSEIESTFGSVEAFKEEFSNAAATCFGSGWAWLARNKEDKLEIYSTSNQDSPYTKGHIPILGLDVWEHAYYLKHQNRRPEYIESFWKALKLL